VETRLLRIGILAICCVALVAVLVGADRGRKPDAAPVRAVYVDLDELVGLHPAWRQLKQIEVALAQLRGDNAAMNLPEKIANQVEKQNALEPACSDVERRDLQDALSESAEAQIAMVESLMRTSVQERKDSLYRELRDEIVQELLERRRELDHQVAADLRALQEASNVDRLNDELRGIALRRKAETAVGIRDELAENAAQHEKVSNRKEQERTARELEITRKASREIHELERQRNDELELRLSKMTSEEERRVAAQLADYRARLMQIVNGDGFGDLSDCADFGQMEDAASIAGWPSDEQGSYIRKQAYAMLLQEHNQLGVRIADDITRKLARVAAEERLELVFARSDKHDDYTEHLARVISEPLRLGKALESGKEDDKG
jgi:hypothetical protein